METSISMRTTAQDGTKNTTTLSYVNPNASDANLKLYAQKLASLTSDTYTGSTKIEKTSLDDAGELLPRNMYLAKGNTSLATPSLDADSNEWELFTVKYEGNGPACFIFPGAVGVENNFCGVFTGNMFTPVAPGEGMSPVTGGTCLVTVKVDANDVYEAGELVITITGGEG